MTDLQPYVTDERHGECWRLLLGDSCERLAELDDESVDLSIYSPPFASLYTYSPSDRDLGNSANTAEFIEHYRFVLDHMLRVTRPGRTSAVHVQQVAILKSRDGYVGQQDFRGAVIQAHLDAGWIYYGEVTIDKNPQLQAVRTKAQGLMFVQLRRDSALSRPALADYVLIFHKPGDNTVPIQPDISNETWIEWASPVWYGIHEMATLNPGSGAEDADDRHICPLQLPLIERAVRLWSNPGELVCSPFAGIGSEGVVALRHGRRFIGIELKPSYFDSACRFLTDAEAAAAVPGLFDTVPDELAGVPPGRTVSDVPPSEAVG
jgi:DNA modification methylase